MQPPPSTTWKQKTMHPFPTHWQHEKTVRPPVFRDQRKNALEINGLISFQFQKRLSTAACKEISENFYKIHGSKQ